MPIELLDDPRYFMAKLKEKIKIGLDEDRMLVLVVQVLLGFECKAAFETGFDRLPVAAQYLKLGSFGILLVALALLLTVPAYHRIAQQGENTPEFASLLRNLMWLALFPFALALGIDLGIVGDKLFGAIGGVVTGLVGVSVAFFFWYGIGALHQRNRGDHKMELEPREPTSLSEKIDSY